MPMSHHTVSINYSEYRNLLLETVVKYYMNSVESPRPFLPTPFGTLHFTLLLFLLCCGKQLQSTYPHYSWAGLDLLNG